MFGRVINEYEYTVEYCGKTIAVSKEAHDYIIDLRNDIHELKRQLANATNEIKAIKPILDDPQYKPPMSNACSECIYSVRNTRTGDIIACRKNALCADFKAKEK